MCNFVVGNWSCDWRFCDLKQYHSVETLKEKKSYLTLTIVCNVPSCLMEKVGVPVFRKNRNTVCKNMVLIEKEDNHEVPFPAHLKV